MRPQDEQHAKTPRRFPILKIFSKLGLFSANQIDSGPSRSSIRRTAGIACQGIDRGSASS